MVDHSDRNQGSDDLYDETAPRSIFAATWFRAVLVLIVLGVIGAVAVPYILDAMNAPPGRLGATAKAPAQTAAPPPAPAPPATQAADPTPGSAPPPTTAAATTPAMPSPPPSEPRTETKDPTVAGSTAAPEPAKPDSTPAPRPAPKPSPGTEVVSTPDAKPAESPTTKPARKPAQKVAKATATQWFVQVGAYKDPATAKRVAARLREANYQVDESTRAAAATVAKATAAPASTGSGDHYDVIIAGGSAEDVNKRLQGKGLTAQATPGGVVVTPSLPLRDAVALSKELAVDGLKVQVRRAAGSGGPSSRTIAASSGGGETLHRVSVGGFGDRATAVATLKELEARGYKPFLTRR
jgi:hypothetical protein